RWTTSTRLPRSTPSSASLRTQLRPRGPSTEERSQRVYDPRHIGRFEVRHRPQMRTEMSRPRPPGDSLPAEQHDRRDAERRSEMADSGVVAEIHGRQAERAGEEREVWVV